jgi:hypothetical protein
MASGRQIAANHTTVRDTVTAFVTRRVQPGSATVLLLGAPFFLLGWTNRTGVLHESNRKLGTDRRTVSA